MYRGTLVTSSSQVLSGPPGARTLAGAHLVAGSAAATAVVRDGGPSGPILYMLACPIGDNDLCDIPVVFDTLVDVTLTGTGAQLVIYS